MDSVKPVGTRIYCPACSARAEDQFEPLDSGANPAYRCRICRLGFEGRIKLPAHAYKTAEYDKVRNHGLGGCRWTNFHHDSAVAADRIDQLKAIGEPPPAGIWVDVGCGNAALLCELRRRGIQVTGVEADEDSCRELGDRLGIPAIPFSHWIATAHPVMPVTSVVSFFDSLEHMLDPVGVLKAAAGSLVPRGWIIIELPDLDAAGNFPEWKHRRIRTDLTEHIWHFSEATFKVLVEKHLSGFRIAHVARPVESRLQIAIVNENKPSESGQRRQDWERVLASQLDEQRLEQRLSKDIAASFTITTE